ncbi:MAG: hypothetical protein JNL84_11250 [Candidatus Accumulibacter sp.]|nr:hypothetical protein [Accumulibacter sp.]
MKSTQSTFRRFLLIGLGVLSANIVAAAGPQPVEREIRPPTLASQQASPTPHQGIDSSAQKTVIPPAPRMPSGETIDSARWVLGGDANANDVALFRRFIASGQNNSELSLPWLLSVVVLLIGGVAYGQRQGRKSKPKQPSHFPA